MYTLKAVTFFLMCYDYQNILKRKKAQLKEKKMTHTQVCAIKNPKEKFSVLSCTRCSCL